jgi:transposase
VSIDEKSFKNRHHYLSILSDPVGGRVLEAEEHRTLEASRRLIDKALTEDEQKAVKRISLDMREAFISVTKKKLPQAALIRRAGFCYLKFKL